MDLWTPGLAFHPSTTEYEICRASSLNIISVFQTMPLAEAEKVRANEGGGVHGHHALWGSRKGIIAYHAPSQPLHVVQTRIPLGLGQGNTRRTAMK